jgi:putative ATP-dependent endonuclease of the OLD family
MTQNHPHSYAKTQYKNIHVVRARGKACLVSLCKILNQFDKGFAILHDADRERVCGTKTKKMRKNAAWTVNQRILDITEAGRKANRIRLVASVPNFEEAFFGEAADGEKPYSALARLKTDDSAFQAIANLLDCLVDWSTPIPVGAIAWTSMDDLKKAVDEFDATSTAT